MLSYNATAIRQRNADTRDQVYNVRGDGNCFFRAVLEAIRLTNVTAFGLSQDSHQTLREMMISHVIENYASNPDYQIGILTSEYGSLDAWIGAMSQNATWCDQMAIRATSDMLMVPITCKRPGDVNGITFGTQYLDVHPITGISNALIVRYQQDMHYDVFVY